MSYYLSVSPNRGPTFKYMNIWRTLLSHTCTVESSPASLQFPSYIPHCKKTQELPVLTLLPSFCRPCFLPLETPGQAPCESHSHCGRPSVRVAQNPHYAAQLILFPSLAGLLHRNTVVLKTT